MKRLAWLALGFVVFLIIVLDTPWTASNRLDPPGPVQGPAGGVDDTTTGSPASPVVPSVTAAPPTSR